MFDYRGLLDRGTRAPLGWEEVFRGFDHFFREFERDLPLTSFGSVPAEISEDNDKYVLKVEVPGVADKDVHVELHEGVLTLSAERATEAPAGYAARRRERGALRFSRSYVLGDQVDAEKTTAELKDGVLTLSLGKSARSQKKNIPVRVS
jgi:HSP20 family molecular chaperone IbpA